MRKSRGEIIRRGGADVAQVLGDDEVGLDLLQQLKINAVEAFAAGQKFPHLAIDGRGAFGVREARFDEHRPGSCLGGKIALVAYAGDLIAQPECEQNFRGRWKQGTNLHVRKCITEQLLTTTLPFLSARRKVFYG